MLDPAEPRTSQRARSYEESSQHSTAARLAWQMGCPCSSRRSASRSMPSRLAASVVVNPLNLRHAISISAIFMGRPYHNGEDMCRQVDKTALLSPIRCHQSPRSVPIFPRPIFSGPANWRKGVTAFAQTLSRTTNSRAARSANFALHSRAFTAPAMPTVGQRVCERSQAFSVRLRPILCRICFAVRASRGKPSMSAGRPRPSGASHTGEKSGNAVVTIELELEGK